MLLNLRPVLCCAVQGSGGSFGGGRMQTLLAALLSVKAISKLSRWVGSKVHILAQQWGAHSIHLRQACTAAGQMKE